MSRLTRKPAKTQHGAGAKAERLLPPPGSVIVRMYRQGLGDCFLLAIATAKPDHPTYVLIDCGVHSRQSSGPDRLREVLTDIVAATGGRIDVVAATHEHADHLSGFVQKGSPFLGSAVTVGQLWLAWTEQPGDHQADALRKKRAKARSRIAAAVAQARRQPVTAAKAIGDRLEGLLDFEKQVEDASHIKAINRRITELGAAAADPNKLSSNERALQLLKALARKVEYCQPGEVRDVPGSIEIRAYVFGPPRDEALLRKDLPTASTGSDGRSKETYLSGGGGSRMFLWAPGLDDGKPPALPPDMSKTQRYPFDCLLHHEYSNSAAPARREKSAARVKWKNAAAVPLETQRFIESTYDKGGDWRRIDWDWLAGADQLALNLDSDTNNTSLVLAFELGPVGAGRVLLFPGDAQVGNWLSWRRQRYRTGSDSQSADDILRRTVLYKVGHHASHNATVRRDSTDTTRTCPDGVPFGLELMENIIALIPVDRASAQKPMPAPWDMPYSPLYRRLRDKASRRVLRSDDSLEPLRTPGDEPDLVPDAVEWNPVPGVQGVLWRKSPGHFTSDPKIALYYDLRIHGDAGHNPNAVAEVAPEVSPVTS